MTIKERTPLSFRRQSIIAINDDAPLSCIDAWPEKSCIRRKNVMWGCVGVQDFSLPTVGRNDNRVRSVEMTVG